MLNFATSSVIRMQRLNCLNHRIKGHDALLMGSKVLPSTSNILKRLLG